MKWQIILLGAILLLLLVVAAINWDQFAAPGQLNLLVRQVEVPLGAAMLGVVALLTVLYLVFLAGARTTQLVETRRFAKEAQEARQLANEAEASRFSELMAHIDTSMQALQDRVAEAEANLGTAIDESHNSLVANLGEMDSRAPAAGPEPNADRGDEEEAGEADRAPA